ncbi:MAG: hypothetical protein PHX53_00960 [Syntrophales bacterium]|nr:hypothetical protein [Syntrophales bacterium]
MKTAPSPKGEEVQKVTNWAANQPDSGFHAKDQGPKGKNHPAKSTEQDETFKNIVSGMERPPDKLGPTVPDLLIVRPLAAIGALITTSAFVATLPVTFPLGKDVKVSTILLEKPWSYVADRPLGVFAPEKSFSQAIDERISTQYQEYYGRVSANRSPLDLK